MDQKDRLKILENMLKTMTAEEFDNFIGDIYNYGFVDGDLGCSEAYDLAFNYAIKQRS